MAQYIDKDALVAEIERQQRRLCILGQSNEVELRKNVAIQNGVYCSLLSFLETLGVEEVDLDKDVDDVMRRFLGHITCREEQLKFAKHFFELGMTVSNKELKGE